MKTCVISLKWNQRKISLEVERTQVTEMHARDVPWISAVFQEITVRISSKMAFSKVNISPLVVCLVTSEGSESGPYMAGWRHAGENILSQPGG